MPDVYLGDQEITADVTISDSARLHVNGLDLEMQTKIADVWTTHQTWTSSYVGTWRLHYEMGKVYLQDLNGTSWVNVTSWG